MFAPRQRPVFLSEDWLGELGAQRLAHLLHALYTGKVAVEQDAPITLNATPGVPPINITNWTPGDVMFQFTDDTGQPVNSVTLGPDGFSSAPAGTTTTTTGGGGGLPGTVMSGSGASYQVAIEGVSGTVAVEQRPSSTDTIPTGTKVVVFTRANGTRFMNVATFI